MTSRVREFFRRYRFLMIVYVPALLLAAWEIGGRIYDDGKAPDEASAADNYHYTLEYATLHQNLYPERPRSDYYRGIDALMIEKDPAKARKFFESALTANVKTDEQLLYYYAQSLVLLKEDPEKINEAVRNWKVNFPRSAFPDPRTVRNVGGRTRINKSVRPFPQANEEP